VIAPFVLAGVAIAAVILQIEDVIGLFTGMDSELGRVIDSLFGIGTAARHVRYLKQEFEELVNFLSENLWILGPLAQIGALVTEDKPAEGRMGKQFRSRIWTGRTAPLPTTATIRNFGGDTPAPLPVASSVQVPGVGSVAQPQRTTTIHRAGDNNNFNISTNDPRVAAREAVRLMDERARRERDAAMPTAADD
jgi:hypothetical protein